MNNDKNINDPLVSVIIPMYNCEEYAHAVLSMFSDQNFKDFEVICVIDGATDGTEEEVKKFCKTDDRFRYIVQENAGAGAARNAGIDIAKGKYIIFSDADDQYSSDYLSRLYEAAESKNADIAVCGSVTFDHIAGEIRNIHGFRKTELFEGRVYSGKKTKHILNLIDVQICNRMLLLDYVKANELKFSVTKASNDIFFLVASVIYSDRLVVVHDDLITIRRFINPESISSTRGKHSHVAVKELQKIYQWMESRDILKYHISDFLKMFDGSVNYEMKQGVNPLFGEEMARILNCEEPWKNMRSDQLMQILKSSFGDTGAEKIITPAGDTDPDEMEKIQARNEIADIRNQSRLQMQELVKKAFLDIYHRDLDDPESESPEYVKYKNERERLYSVLVQENKKFNKSDDPEITVVIPMYNCEEYVNRVLSMFTAQSFTDYEVICVIDGATDNTEKLVSAFCKKDFRFRYVVQENGGPGAARNTGLDMARGKYIIFSDADDEYSVDYLKKMYEISILHDAQIVVSFFVEKNNISNTENVIGFDKNRFHEHIPYSHYCIEDLFVTFVPHVANKLFNRDFIVENGIRFPETMVSEDSSFCYISLVTAEKILLLHEALLNYSYYVNPDSISSKRNRFQHQMVHVLRILYNWLKDHYFLDVHLVDYMKRVKSVLAYASEIELTPRFISETAHLLNKEEPWNSMTSGEVLEYLKEALFANYSRNMENYFKEHLSPAFIDSDKELSLRMKRYRNRIHMAELLRQVSIERYGRDFSDPESLPFSSKEEQEDHYINHYLPSKVCFEASTMSGFGCKGSGIQEGGTRKRGFLTINDFRKFCERNPFVKEIELSIYGDVFSDPDLTEIIYNAKARGIVLTAWNGVDFDAATDEQMQAMVDIRFRGMTLLSYGKNKEACYKGFDRGIFNKMIENVTKLSELKKKVWTKYPELKWQYILEKYDEQEIEMIKEVARDLEIPVEFKFDRYDKNRSAKPDNTDDEKALSEHFVSDHADEGEPDITDTPCRQIFTIPRINWDGKLLGCSAKGYPEFDVNVFDEGLEKALKTPQYIDTKKCLLTVYPQKEQYESCNCYDCEIRRKREMLGKVLDL